MKLIQICKYSSFVVASLLLQACGGAADSAGGTTPSGAIGPHTIALSYPISDSIENLGGGFYRRIGKVTVTDSEGNGIAGVTVKFKLIDSILAYGSIINGTGDYISSTTLYDTDPLLGDGSNTTFRQAWVYRNSRIRYIQNGDHVLLFNADEGDKRRSIGDTAISDFSLNVSDRYINAYPNSVYDSSDALRTTSYVIGASLLGGYITGENGVAFQTVTDSQGIGTFYVVYPSNYRVINTGCDTYVINNDARHQPTGSSVVFVAAWVNDDVSAISGSYCYSPIAGGSIVPTGDTYAPNATVTFTVYDGGDGVRIPYTEVKMQGAVVGYTDIDGNITLTLPGADGPYKITANRGAEATFTIKSSP